MGTPASVMSMCRATHPCTRVTTSIVPRFGTTTRTSIGMARPSAGMEITCTFSGATMTFTEAVTGTDTHSVRRN